MAAALIAVPLATATPARAAQVPGSSLVIEARTEGKLVDNFNPFSTANPLTEMGVPSYIYEPLLQYNELQVDQYYPWLAQSWSFSSSGQTITFNLRPGVKWDDGSAFTAADAAYTFNLIKAHPRLDHGLPLVSAVAVNRSTLTLTLSRPGYAYLYDIARVPIVKNGYAAGATSGSYVDRAPDGTGPYRLARPRGFSPARVVLEARAGYWQQGEPAIGKLVFPAYPDSAAALSALSSGQLDWSALRMPSVKSHYVAKDNAHNHYWFAPVGCISLELNLARYPTNELAVRRAISKAVDRDALSAQVEGGHDPPATSSSGLVLPTDSQFLVRADTNDIRGGADPAGAALLMKGAGYHLGADGYWTTLAGHVLSFDLVDPAGSQFAAAARMVAKQLRQAGFDARFTAATSGRWQADLAEGNFDGSVLASATGPSPYYMYESWLDPSLLVGGHAAGGDYERLDRATAPSVAATVAKELAAYNDSLSGSPQATAATQALAAVVSTQQPIVPLMYDVAWGEFSTRHAQGWPGDEDPYEPAVPEAPFAEYTVLQLSPSSI
ncbi:MAG: ABC transporter substrate-binding protein [Acidimicrobiales bacterium]